MFNAPDTAGGKRAKCPKCGGVIQIPAQAAADEILDAEPEVASPYTDDDFAVEAPAKPADEVERKPCPKCGEMIARNALKCRFCGEIFDPMLAMAERREGKGESRQDSQDKTNAIVIFVTSILGCFSPIVAIYGIIFLLKRPYSFPYKGLAIAGTIIHCLWTAFLVVRIATMAAQ
jgi:predicted RNA-binding Zn-ribbon protein involved in translation (DUF1610 family)